MERLATGFRSAVSSAGYAGATCAWGGLRGQGEATIGAMGQATGAARRATVWDAVKAPSA